MSKSIDGWEYIIWINPLVEGNIKMSKFIDGLIGL